MPANSRKRSTARAETSAGDKQIAVGGPRHFTPKDQIILLAGLLADSARRSRIWALCELSAHRSRLTEAGLIDAHGLCEPEGVAAARRLHHIALNDLIAEHLPGAPMAAAGPGSDNPEEGLVDGGKRGKPT